MVREPRTLQNLDLQRAEAQQCHSETRLGAPCRYDHAFAESHACMETPSRRELALGAACWDEVPNRPFQSVGPAMRSPPTQRTKNTELLIFVPLRTTSVSRLHLADRSARCGQGWPEEDDGDGSRATSSVAADEVQYEAQEQLAELDFCPRILRRSQDSGRS